MDWNALTLQALQNGWTYLVCISIVLGIEAYFSRSTLRYARNCLTIALVFTGAILISKQSSDIGKFDGWSLGNGKLKEVRKITDVMTPGEMFTMALTDKIPGGGMAAIVYSHANDEVRCLRVMEPSRLPAPQESFEARKIGGGAVKLANYLFLPDMQDLPLRRTNR